MSAPHQGAVISDFGRPDRHRQGPACGFRSWLSSSGYFFFFAPYFFLAFLSHATRLCFVAFAFPLYFFLHALSAFASFCLRVKAFFFGQPLTAIFVLCL